MLCDDVVRQSTRCLQAPGHGAPFLVLAFEGEALRLDVGAQLARPRRARHLFAAPRQVLVGVGRRGRVVERTEAAQVPAPRLVGRAARSAFDVQAAGAQAAPGRDSPELVSRDVDVLRLRALNAHALRRRLSERPPRLASAAAIGVGSLSSARSVRSASLMPVANALQTDTNFLTRSVLSSRGRAPRGGVLGARFSAELKVFNWQRPRIERLVPLLGPFCRFGPKNA